MHLYIFLLYCNNFLYCECCIDLIERLQSKMEQFTEHDKQFPSSILEGGSVNVKVGSEPELDVPSQPDNVYPTIAPAPAPRVWRREDLSMLARALSKYPGGTRQRWVLISNALNDWIKPDVLFTPDECTKGANFAMKHLSKSKDATVSTVQSAHTLQHTNMDSTSALWDQPASKHIAENCDISDSPVVSSIASDFSGEWTQLQQTALEQGIVKYSSDLPASKRWDLISICVPGKSSDECLSRYRELRDKLRNKKKLVKKISTSESGP